MTMQFVWILAILLTSSLLEVSSACEAFTAVEAYRNGPYVAFKTYLTKTAGLGFRENFGTFKSIREGLFFFTYSSDAPLTLRKNRIPVSYNFNSEGVFGTSSAVLHVLPGDIVYLYSIEPAGNPFTASFSGFLVGGDSCYNYNNEGAGQFGGGDGHFGGGGNDGGGGYNGGRFPGSQGGPPVPSPAIYGRSGRSNSTSVDTPQVGSKKPGVVTTLGQPDEDDKIFELIKQ